MTKYFTGLRFCIFVYVPFRNIECAVQESSRCSDTLFVGVGAEMFLSVAVDCQGIQFLQRQASAFRLALFAFLAQRGVDCFGNHRVHFMFVLQILPARGGLSVAGRLHALGLRLEGLTLFCAVVSFTMQHASFLPLGVRIVRFFIATFARGLTVVGLGLDLLKTFSAFDAFTERHEFAGGVDQGVEILCHHVPLPAVRVPEIEVIAELVDWEGSNRCATRHDWRKQGQAVVNFINTRCMDADFRIAWLAHATPHPAFLLSCCVRREHTPGCRSHGCDKIGICHVRCGGTVETRQSLTLEHCACNAMF